MEQSILKRGILIKVVAGIGLWWALRRPAIAKPRSNPGDIDANLIEIEETISSTTTKKTSKPNDIVGNAIELAGAGISESAKALQTVFERIW